jgi:hypothetical protein
MTRGHRSRKADASVPRDVLPGTTRERWASGRRNVRPRGRNSSAAIRMSTAARRWPMAGRVPPVAEERSRSGEAGRGYVAVGEQPKGLGARGRVPSAREAAPWLRLAEPAGPRPVPGRPTVARRSAVTQRQAGARAGDGFRRVGLSPEAGRDPERELRARCAFASGSCTSRRRLGEPGRRGAVEPSRRWTHCGGPRPAARAALGTRAFS